MKPYSIQEIVEYLPEATANAIEKELNDWRQQNKIQRLWANDASLWTNHDEAQWMGWLNVIASELNEIPRIEALADEIKAADIQHIVLLGMGGSSLCPALLTKTFGKIANNPHLHILDSTDPLQIRRLENQIDLKKTFFIVSSKSGTTLEPNIFKQYFYNKLQTTFNKQNVGDHFLAITDPGTPLAIMAKNEHFKAIFYGIPSIGGRYSALSNFGMVPLGLMGVDVREFLHHAEKMRQACSTILPENNPGVLLGIILGVCAKHGKDKITLITSPDIHTLGAWLGQLLAESTGKIDKGLIPIDQESLGTPDNYSNDRVFIYIRLENAPDIAQDHAVAQIEQSGHIVVRLHLSDKKHLGAELFRWEIATAVASSVIGINPFNQPDVEAGKIRTLQLTTNYEKTGKIPKAKPIFSTENIQLFTDEKNATEITEKMIGTPSIETYLRAHFSRIRPGDYVDLSAFIEMSEEHITLLQDSRTLIRDAKKVATCLGFGPRFLHSTGQIYKGGPNTGVFLQITADHETDILIPDYSYTFGVVITTQAQGDFEILAQRTRRVLRIHLEKSRTGLQQLREFLRRAFQYSAQT